MIRIGRISIAAQRWPWQAGYNWRGMSSLRAPLNPAGARFGGGWRYKVGIDIGGRTIILNLLLGMLRFTINDKRNA